MVVIKRNGKEETVNPNKILLRLKKLKDLEPILTYADEFIVAQKVIAGLYDKVSTQELDELAAEISATMSTIHPDYNTLAARIEVSNLHKETDGIFSKNIALLFDIGIIGSSFNDYIKRNNSSINTMVDYSRDYGIDYFGIKTLKKSYLLKDKKGTIIERPQDMWMRTAAFVHMPTVRVETGSVDQIKALEKTKETYDLMSQKYFTHATPTLFNSGTVRPQLSSCFLLDVDSDSISGIYKTLSDCATISQSAGGIGISIHKIRSKGSYIAGTNGNSNGIVPMLRVFDSTARYVDQGGGKRKGSIAVYIEPWHSDIYEFLDLKKNHGKEELRARDLFYALWIPDLFMKRVEENGVWSLFDPKDAFVLVDDKKKYLYDIYGNEFNALFSLLESEGKYKKQVSARELWEKILTSQIESGGPYMLYKDAANKKSNQSNLGTIKSSNLCTEIIEYTDEKETAVCNLASISLPAFINATKDGLDFEKLYKVSQIITENLNKLIDVNYYPTKEARYSNTKHRPVGIGVQGLADVYAILKIDFDSEEAKKLNKKIFEIIYKGSVSRSIELAKIHGAYESYKGSPASEGKLQFHLWGTSETELSQDWKGTMLDLREYGLRNSLLLAPMPTASTSQILGNNEAFEPFTSNLYTRRTLAGDFIVINKHLVRDLIENGLWSDSMRQKLMLDNGSIQGIQEIPHEIRSRYRTAYEMSARAIIDQAADRGPFICQSQSMNIFMSNPTVAKLTSMHFYGWKRGLKTGSYYIRGESAADAIKFTLDKNKANESKKEEQFAKVSENIEDIACSIDNPEDCEACGS